MTQQEPDYDKIVSDYIANIKASFQYCLSETFRLLKMKAAYVQLDISDWMHNGPRKRGVLGTRGIAKTTLAEVYCLWRLLKNPNEMIMLLSKTEGHAKKSMIEIQSWINIIPFFRILKPNKRKGHRDSTTEMDVGPCNLGRIPSISAFGIDGQITGNRCSILIPDDVETPKNTITRARRDNLYETMQEVEHTLIPDADIIYLGTYHHEDSIYKKIVKKQDNIPGIESESAYTLRAWPALYPKPGEVDKIPHLAPMYLRDLKEGKAVSGDPVWPERLNMKYFAQLHVSKTSFNMQCMLKPVIEDADRTPLKHGDLIVFDCKPYIAPVSIAWGTHTNDGTTTIEELEPMGLSGDVFRRPIFIDAKWERFHGTKAWLDPAGTNTKREPDEMSLGIVGQLYGILYAKHVSGRYGGATTENLTEVVKLLRQYDARELYIEKNFGGEAIAQLIQPIIQKFIVPLKEDGTSTNSEFPYGWACTVIPVSSNKQKEVIICNALEPIMNSHRLVVDTSLAKDETLMYQMTRITREKACLEHDDRIEALARCVEQWTEYLDQDAVTTSAANEEEQRRETVRKYLESLGINTNDGDSSLQSYQHHRQFYGSAG